MTPTTEDITALREHLRAEARSARDLAMRTQRIAANAHLETFSCWQSDARNRQLWAAHHASTARGSTAVWLAADTRLRTVDALIADRSAIPERARKVVR